MSVNSLVVRDEWGMKWSVADNRWLVMPAKGEPWRRVFLCVNDQCSGETNAHWSDDDCHGVACPDCGEPLE